MISWLGNQMNYQRKVCVLGGGGSIGSQLVFRLWQQGYQITAVVRTLSSAVRIGRYNVCIVKADLLSCSEGELVNIIAGHMAVIDCTYSVNNDYNFRIEESRKLADLICRASTRAGVNKLVHYGTISVYPTTSQEISEDTKCVPQREAYADSKLVAEQMFLSQSFEGLSVTVLQLPVVYGPFMMWTTAPIDNMSEHTYVMPDDLAGYCSPIYVDDVAKATLLVIKSDTQWVERILLQGPEDMSWSDYYQAYAELSSQTSLELLSRDEVLNVIREQKVHNQPWQLLKSKFSRNGDFRQLLLSQLGIRTFYNLAKRLFGQAGIDEIKVRIANQGIEPKFPDQKVIDMGTMKLFDTMPAIKSNKAKELLGFQPETGFDEGIKLSAEWLRWAHIIE